MVVGTDRGSQETEAVQVQTHLPYSMHKIKKMTKIIL